MLAFNRKWFLKSKGCWVVEFVGGLKKEEASEDLLCEYIFPKSEAMIAKFAVQDSEHPDIYRYLLDGGENNKIIVGFRMLKPEKWWAPEGVDEMNVRIWVYAYEHLPEEYVYTKYSKVYHKGTCYIVRRIKNPIVSETIPEGKRPCKRCG